MHEGNKSIIPVLAGPCGNSFYCLTGLDGGPVVQARLPDRPAVLVFTALLTSFVYTTQLFFSHT